MIRPCAVLTLLLCLAPAVLGADPHPASNPIGDRIDRFSDGAMSAAQVKPAPLADDGVFLRRVYLHLADTLPTAERDGAFLNDKAPSLLLLR